jgi:hypothetical protein
LRPTIKFYKANSANKGTKKPANIERVFLSAQKQVLLTGATTKAAVKAINTTTSI